MGGKKVILFLVTVFLIGNNAADRAKLNFGLKVFTGLKGNCKHLVWKTMKNNE